MQVLLNLLNLCTLPFRPRQPTGTWTNPFNLTEQPSEATLNLIANSISSTNPYIRSITLGIFPPVFFQSLPVEAQGLLERSEHAVGGFLEGWTRSIGDPVISKWIVVVLCMSMGLNAWLLNAARHGAMQPIYSSATKSGLPEIVLDKSSKGASTTPAYSVAAEKPVPKVNTFVLNDSESDDEDKHMSVVKSRNRRIRSVSECMRVITEGHPQELLDEEVVALVLQKKIPLYALEKSLKDLERAVRVRRAAVCMHLRIINSNGSSRINNHNSGDFWSSLQTIRLWSCHGGLLRERHWLCPHSSRSCRALYH
jgi:hydroxymethylglutaryl-CoA reductase (NADPH)